MRVTASALVRLFPRDWRSRYGDEFSALLDARPLTARDAAGAVRLALGEWLQPGASVVMVPFVLAELSALAGRLLQQLLPRGPGLIGPIGVALVSLWYVGLGIQRLTASWRHFMRSGTWGPLEPMSNQAIGALMAAIWSVAVCGVWAGMWMHTRLFIEAGPVVPVVVASPVFWMLSMTSGWSKRAQARHRAMEARAAGRRAAATPQHPLGLS